MPTTKMGASVAESVGRARHGRPLDGVAGIGAHETGQVVRLARDGEHLEQARDGPLPAVPGMATDEAQAPHPDDRAPLQPAGEEQGRQPGDGDDASQRRLSAVRIELADDAEEHERLLEVELLDGGRDGPTDGHLGCGEPEQDVVVPRAQRVAGRHDGEAARGWHRAAVAVLLEQVAHVERDVVLDLCGHLLDPSPGPPAVEGTGRIPLPPLVRRGHAVDGAAIRVHALVVRLVHERADAPQLAIGIADDVLVAHGERLRG